MPILSIAVNEKGELMLLLGLWGVERYLDFYMIEVIIICYIFLFGGTAWFNAEKLALTLVSKHQNRLWLLIGLRTYQNVVFSQDVVNSIVLKLNDLIVGCGFAGIPLEKF